MARKPHHGRGGSQHVGRLRIRAAKLLSAAFPQFEIQPEDVTPVTGAYRTDTTHDVYRWEVFARYRNSDMPVVLHCWDSLTQFVKEARKGQIELNALCEIFVKRAV